MPVALLAAVVVALAVSFRMDDPDFWQHLTVGRAIWELGRIPHENLWTWSGFGEPYLLPSWLFRAMLWPFWQAGGEWGLALWRWLFTLATFGLAWVVARRAGARGFAPLVAIVWCAVAARQRSMVRPEMLAGLLLVIELWLLERRRAGHWRIAWALVPLAAVWINAHISYTLFFEVGLAYLADAWVRRREGADPGGLALAMGAAFVACFANPFGWAAVWQPFDYVLHQGREPIYQGITELHGIPWRRHVRDGLPLLLTAIPLLGLVRWRRKLDVAQLLLYVAFLSQALGSVRFVGPLLVVAAPFFARDLAAALGSVRWPAWTRPPLARAALAAAGLALVATPELLRPEAPIGLGFRSEVYPVAACDWIERQGVRGRSFVPFDRAGYVLWRFWPERDRLPFMDIHQTGTRRDRDLVAVLAGRPDAWAELSRRHRFDWVLLPRDRDGLAFTEDYVDADSAYSRAFVDDQWVVWLRREGPMAALAESLRYRLLPGSYRGLGALGDSVTANPALRPLLRAELDRSIRESPRANSALGLYANLELLEGNWAAALERLRELRRRGAKLDWLDGAEKAASDSLAALEARLAR